jgi:hypothetical protein
MKLRLCVLLLLSTLSLVQRPAVGQDIGVRPAEDFSSMTGRWRAEPSFPEAVGPKPRFVNILAITASPTEVKVDRGYSPVETYRLDGTVTDFGNGFVGSAVPIAEGLLLTTKRVSRPSMTTWADTYQMTGDKLVVDSRRSQRQPDGTLIAMKDARVTIAYRRMP